MIIVVIIMGCSNKNKTVEYWPTHGWQDSTPEKMGMDSEKLVKMLDEIESSSIDSVTIIRNGYIVLDTYIYPYQPGRLHAILSCTKSITLFLLSAVLQTATGMKASEFADEYLFGKLGIEHYTWNEHSSGVNLGYGSIRMNNLDLAKIGYLYLKNGRWENEQIISKQWIKESTTSHVKKIKDGSGDVYDYGYQWWVETEDLFSAQGKGGQYIIIDRKNNLVVVFTSSFPDRFGYKPKDFYSNYIVSSIISDTVIVENPSASKELKEKTQDLSGSINVEPEALPIPIWLNDYNGKEFTYEQRVFQTEKIIFNIDVDNNILSLTSIDSNNKHTIIQTGLNGPYHYNNVRPDLIIAAKAEIIDNRILWETAIPELGWRAEYNYKFKVTQSRLKSPI